MAKCCVCWAQSGKLQLQSYLSGIAMEKTIQGHQDAGVQACAKHWVGNEQEIQRNPTYDQNVTTVKLSVLSLRIWRIARCTNCTWGHLPTLYQQG